LSYLSARKKEIAQKEGKGPTSEHQRREKAQAAELQNFCSLLDKPRQGEINAQRGKETDALPRTEGEEKDERLEEHTL